MIGRGACGQPWLPARIVQTLVGGKDPGAPSLRRQGEIAVGHVEAMLSAYGTGAGLRNARKHIGWYLAASGRAAAELRDWRRRLCTSEDAASVLAGLSAFYRDAEGMAA